MSASEIGGSSFVCKGKVGGRSSLPLAKVSGGAGGGFFFIRDRLIDLTEFIRVANPCRVSLSVLDVMCVMIGCVLICVRVR